MSGTEERRGSGEDSGEGERAKSSKNKKEKSKETEKREKSKETEMVPGSEVPQAIPQIPGTVTEPTIEQKNRQLPVVQVTDADNPPTTGGQNLVDMSLLDAMVLPEEDLQASATGPPELKEGENEAPNNGSKNLEIDTLRRSERISSTSQAMT